MTARHASVNEAELFFERFGKGVPILVMHGGLGLDHTYFRSWLDKLGEHAELIFYDHRGNGRSTRAVSLAGVDHATFAADADQLRAHLGLDRIIVLGHSYGGFLAQEYASRYGSEGGHLAGLILCSTAPALDSMPVTHANTIARLHEIKVPTLVISGADDWITPPEQGQRIQAVIANAEFALFEQSGHFPFIEETDKFIDTVSGGLRRMNSP